MQPELRRAIDKLIEREQITGYDPFGFRPEALDFAAPPVHWLYRNYFRCELSGLENVPEGRVLLVANHSGQLPIDAAMIAMALLVAGERPRAVRSMIERFVPTLPFVFTFLNRAGQLVGTPDNARRLLRRENALLVFPEGARGISKPFSQRYELERFGTGFMRLALETNTPIVPVGVVGAEEQYISLGNMPTIARMMSAPSFPMLLNLLPLPVKYRIRFGEPIVFSGDPEDEDRVIRSHVRQVSSEVETLIADGLREREGWFQ
jgi:1-acyl-sn-glycerol-3-phosphate acyltransferase